MRQGALRTGAAIAASLAAAGLALLAGWLGGSDLAVPGPWLQASAVAAFVLALTIEGLRALRRHELRAEAFANGLRHVADELGEALWIYDPRKGRVVRGRSAFARIWRRDTEPHADVVLDLVHTDDRERLREAFAPEGPDDDRGSLLFRLRRPDHGWSWVWIRYARVPDPERGYAVIAGLSADVTSQWEAFETIRRSRAELEESVRERTAELVRLNDALRREIAGRTETERELRLSRSLYRKLLQNSFELLCELDASGRLVHANARFGEALEYAPDELIGRSVLDLVHPEDVDSTRFEFLGALLDEKPVSATSRLRDRSGRWHFFEWSAVPIGEGDDRRILCCSRDVTARMRAERRFRELFESAPDALVAVDSEGRIRLFNGPAETVFGWSRDDVLGEPVELLVPGLHRQEHAALRRAFLSEGRSRRMGTGRELFGLRKGGEEIPVEINLSHLSTDDDPLVVAAVRDVTQRVRAEQERAALEARIQHGQKLESLGVLAGGIAHDFNNLLAGIVNYASLALARLDVDDRARQPVSEIKAVALRMAELANQLLAYAGRGAVLIEPVDLSGEVSRIRALLSASISKKAFVEEMLAADLPPVEGDPSQIGQVVMNLITNASEALPDGVGTIAIRTGLLSPRETAFLEGLELHGEPPEGPLAYVEVTDTGGGMDASTRARLYDPFFTTKREGRGLGMAAVRGIVLRHRGCIGVASAPGRGSRFVALFPVAPGERLPCPPLETRGQRDVEGAVVLLVDDEASVREPARLMLEDHGVEVIACVDGREALECFRAAPDSIDLVILDLTMPGLSGREALAEMRALRPDLTAIVCSGYSHLELADELRGDERAEFLQKPYEVDALLAAIRRLLDSTCSDAEAAPRAREPAATVDPTTA